MKNLKICCLLFIVLFLGACDKDKPSSPDDELEYPVSYYIDHYNVSGASKFYVVGENNTYSEVTVSDDYRAFFEDEVVENTDEIFKIFELRTMVFESAIELSATYEYINPNSLVVENDTLITHEIVKDGNKVTVANLQTFFLSNQNEKLLLPHRVYGSSSYDFDYVDNLDENFTLIANLAVNNLVPQDTFGVKFFDLVYKKE